MLITFSIIAPINTDEFERIVMDYGCPKAEATRIAQRLNLNGEHTCSMTLSVYMENRVAIQTRLKEIGVKAEKRNVT